MKHFVGIVEKEPGSLWSIWFPDCPGCTTAAEDFETAVGQAKDALRLWVDAAADDGGAVILPRTLDQLRTDPAVLEALAQGQAAILVPLIQESGRSVRANISLDAGLLQSIDMAAKARGLTRSAFLASAAREKILAEV